MFKWQSFPGGSLYNFNGMIEKRRIPSDVEPKEQLFFLNSLGQVNKNSTMGGVLGMSGGGIEESQDIVQIDSALHHIDPTPQNP